MEFSRLVKAALTVLLLVGTSMAQAAMTMGEAIDRAGQQRMLSQRIAQNYLLAAIQPDNAKGLDRMQRAIAAFDDNLSRLQGFDRAEAIRPELIQVKTLWLPYKNLAQSDINADNATKLLIKSDEILAATHLYVSKLEALSDGKTGELVNVSGRQRMLSQRIAKNYFAWYFKVGGEERIKALYEDLAEYENVIGYLKQSPLNTVEINAKLNKVEGQFNYASKGFDGLMQITGDRLIYVITGTTDAMLKNMDDVTKLYAAL